MDLNYLQIAAAAARQFRGRVVGFPRVLVYMDQSGVAHFAAATLTLTHENVIRVTEAHDDQRVIHEYQPWEWVSASYYREDGGLDLLQNQMTRQA